MNTNITSLGLSIDGGYFCKINDGLYQVGYRLNLAKLSRYIRECIADRFGLDASQCLITGDADHEMLARKIKALKKQVVLVTWNMAEKDSTSPALKEEVTMHIDLDEIAKEDAALLGKICDAIN